MSLAQLLGIQRGVTSVIGSGGKTSLLAALACELSAQGASVVLTTTTHILPFEGRPLVIDAHGEKIAAALEGSRVVCVGAPCEGGKLGTPGVSMEELARLADFVLVEADGSRRLPLKAHAAHEPVIPGCSGQAILVVGASGLCRPIAEVVHRPEVFCGLLGCGPCDLATPARVAQVLLAEGLGNKVLVNQVDAARDWEAAELLASYMDVSVVAGSLRAPQSFRRLG